MTEAIVGILCVILGYVVGSISREREFNSAELRVRREIMAWSADKLRRWSLLLDNVYDRATARALAESLSDTNPKLEATWRLD
jgi:hypothetical protein